jgi:hypothetical protein
VKTEESWQVKRQEALSEYPKKPTVQPGDAFEDEAFMPFKPGFGMTIIPEPSCRASALCIFVKLMLPLAF